MFGFAPGTCTGAGSIDCSHPPPSAVISGQLVHVGERVDDATVTAIDPSGVTLRTARGLVRLAIAPEVIKSPTGTPSQSGLAGRKEAR